MKRINHRWTTPKSQDGVCVNCGLIREVIKGATIYIDHTRKHHVNAPQCVSLENGSVVENQEQGGGTTKRNTVASN